MARRILLLILLTLPLGVQAQEAPSPITALCGGGVTGQVRGRQAMPDGRILDVSGMAGAVTPSQAEPLGQDLALVRRWTEELRAAGFMQMKLRQLANYSCSLAWNGVVLSWPGEAAPAALPARIHAVFLALRGFGRERR